MNNMTLPQDGIPLLLHPATTEELYPRTSSFLGLTFLLLATVTTYLTYMYVKLSRMKSVPPFKEIPTVPHVHWLLGHFPYFHTLEPSLHHSIFSSNSSPSGITGFWADFERRAFTVLRADHVRAVLRQNSSRDPMKLISRHGCKTLGEESLILIPGGTRWRKQRSVVAKMFTADVIRGKTRAVADCGRTVVRWLLHACSPTFEEDCPGHDGEGVYMEAENLFKLYSLQVFGRISMGYDFKCFHNPIPHLSCGDSKTCRCLRMSKVAESFAFLQGDIAMRAQPPNCFNPMVQCYSLPTSYNKQYHHHAGVVRNTIGDIIAEELDALMEETNNGIAEEEKEEGEANLVANLLRSTFEDQFHPSPPMDASLSSSTSSRCPFDGSMSVSSKCPFDGSTSTAPSFVPQSLSPAQKQATIDNVSGILRTLLMAGFETTAVSLSYVMYFLSIHPRCQDHCAEEADRILGRSNEDVTYHPNVNADDLVYCRAVFTETIRLHLPIIFTTRVLEKDMSFDTGNGEDRMTLPKGTKALISPSAIHSDERNFERAREFIPERWVRWDGDRWIDRDYEKERKAGIATPAAPSSSPSQDPTSISAANPQNFFSFSDGARNCVGKRLAILESSLMIAMLLRDLRVDLAEGGFELVTKLKFATVGPVRLPVVFRKR